MPLGTRLFRSRVQLLAHAQASPGLDPDGALAKSLTTDLHGKVAAMNRENFVVRMHLEAVDRFRELEAWEKLCEADQEKLQREIAGLPGEIETDEVESRLFDLTAVRMQLAHAEGDVGAFEELRQRVVEIAILLEEKSLIPAVKAQLAYLASMQELDFWEGIDLNGLEELRCRLRGLVPFLDKKKRKVVYTDFQDDVVGVRDDTPVFSRKKSKLKQKSKTRKSCLSSSGPNSSEQSRVPRPIICQNLIFE